MVNIMSILIPAYFYPSNCSTPYTAKSSACAWSPLFTAVEANKMYNFTFVINPASGPGPYPPDANWISVVNQVNSYNNTRSVGYVDSWFSTIPEPYYKANITTYNQWASYKGADIHMDGIFVDDMDTHPGNLSYYTKFISNVNTIFPASNERYVVLNPGAVIDCSFYGNLTSGTVITFEDYYANLANADFKKAAYNACPRYKQTVLVHTFNGTAVDQQQLSDDMGETYRIGNFFNTNTPFSQYPYQSIPPLWSQLAASVTATDTWISQHPQWYS